MKPIEEEEKDYNNNEVNKDDEVDKDDKVDKDNDSIRRMLLRVLKHEIVF